MVRLPLPARELGALLLAGLAVRLGLAWQAGITGPLGPDLPYWGYAAVEWQHGAGPSTHPPLIPVLAGLTDQLLGCGVVWPQWILVLLSGVLLAPAAALVLASLAGPLAGRLAGLLTLGLPAILAASLQVEPVAVALLWLLLMLWLAAGMARQASLPMAVALGAAGALSAATKEGGWVDLAALALPALLLAPRRRLVLLAGLGVGGALVAVVLALVVGEAGSTGVAGKSALPFADVLAWVQQGQVPPPLTQPGDPVGPLSQAQVAAFAAMSPAQRAPRALAIQAWRLLVLLGPWALLVPTGIGLLTRAWRRGQQPAWLAVPVLLRALAVLGGLVVVIQGRHAEWLALGGSWALALVLAKAGRGWQALAVVMGLAWTAASLAGTADHLRGIHQQARDEQAMAAWAEQTLPEGVALYSPLYIVGVHTDRLTHLDQLRSTAPEGPSWVLFRQGTHPDEGREAVGELLEPLCARRELSAPSGSFILAEARQPDCDSPAYKDRLQDDGTLALAEAPGSRRATPSSRRRARPGRTRRDVDSVPDGRED